MPPLAIVCIIGMGRSGSTLLDRMIGTLPGAVPVGESRSIVRRIHGAGSDCSCGAPLSSCPLWAAAWQKTMPSDFDIAADLTNERRILGRRSVAKMLLRAPTGAAAADLHAYAAARRAIYEAVLEQSGGSVIVDSTKFWPYALALARSGEFQVRAIHLVRDPRGVAFSHLKREPGRVEGPDDDRIDRARPVTRWSRRWLVLNALAELAGRRAMAYHRVRYEDLVANPQSTLRRLVAFAQIPGELPDLAGDSVTMPVHHIVGSNGASRATSGRVAIRVDDQWRAGLSAKQRATVTALTLPVLVRHRYPVWPRAPRP
ncbi:MAG: sulfotransferase family protein [Dehalococcoidia bacterium]